MSARFITILLACFLMVLAAFALAQDEPTVDNTDMIDVGGKCEGPFTGVVLGDTYDLELTVGQPYSCTKEGDNRHCDNVRFWKEGDTVHIGAKVQPFKLEPGRCTVSISAPTINTLKVRGSGRALAKGFDGGPLDVVTGGSGDLELQGHADTFSAKVRGSGDFYGDNFTAGNTDFTVSGSGNAKIGRVVGNLNAKVKGAGNFELVSGKIGRLDIQLFGSGNGNLTGEANQLIAKIKGSSDLKAGDLRTKSVGVTILGTGNGIVRASKSITGQIIGTGNLTYYGDPERIKVNATGTGKVVKGK